MSRKTITRTRATACGVAAAVLLGVAGTSATSAFAAGDPAAADECSRRVV